MQLKRLNSVQWSPILSFFEDSASGAKSIRAYRKQQQYISECDTRFNHQYMTHVNVIAIKR